MQLSTADIRQKRLLLVIAYIGFVSLGLPDGVIGVAWPFVRDEFHLEQGTVGLAFIAAGAGYFLTSFSSGRFTKLLGIGTVLAGSSALVTSSSFTFSLAPAWAVFVTASVLHGLGSGGIDAGLNHYAAHRFSARHMNWLHACYSLGATIGPLLMTFVITATGSWRRGYATIGSIMLALTLVFIYTRRFWRISDEAKETEHAPSLSTSATLRHAIVWLQMVMFFCYTGLEISVGQWSFTLLTESRLVETRTAGIWVGIYWGSIAVGRVFFGFLTERLGIDALLRGGISLAILGSLLVATRLPEPAALIGLICIGVGIAPIYPCLMTKTPERLGTALAAHGIGFQVGAAMVGGALIPSFVGLLAQRFGLEMTAMAPVVLALVLAILHEVLIARTPRAETALPSHTSD